MIIWTFQSQHCLVSKKKNSHFHNSDIAEENRQQNNKLIQEPTGLYKRYRGAAWRQVLPHGAN